MDAKMLKAADFLGKVIREAAEHKTKIQVYSESYFAFILIILYLHSKYSFDQARQKTCTDCTFCNIVGSN